VCGIHYTFSVYLILIALLGCLAQNGVEIVVIFYWIALQRADRSLEILTVIGEFLGSTHENLKFYL